MPEPSHDPALRWRSSESIPKKDGSHEEQIFDAEDRVAAIHPIYVIPYPAVERCHAWVDARTSF